MGCYIIQYDTIRLNAYFETFAGVGSDPIGTTLKIYDEDRNLLISATTTSGILNGSTSGLFYYDYTTVNVGTHFYEFAGTLETKMIYDRGAFYVTWA